MYLGQVSNPKLGHELLGYKSLTPCAGVERTGFQSSVSRHGVELLQISVRALSRAHNISCVIFLHTLIILGYFLKQTQNPFKKYFSYRDQRLIWAEPRVWKRRGRNSTNCLVFKQIRAVFNCQKHLRFVLSELNRTSPVSLEKSAFKCVYLQLKRMKKATKRVAF